MSLGLAPAQDRDQHTDVLCPSWPPQGNARAPSSSPPCVRSSILAWWGSVSAVLPWSWKPAPEELPIQCLPRSPGICATSWDMEEKLHQLTWHHDPKLSGVPVRCEGEEKQEQGACRQTSWLALGSLSLPGLISIP